MSHTITVVRVALPVPLFQQFDYLLPSNIQPESCHIGARVRVPFGKNKTRVGIITALPTQSDVDTDKLKMVDQLLDRTAILPPNLVKLADWLTSYYHYPLGDVYAVMLPTLLRQGKPLFTPEALYPPKIVWLITPQHSVDDIATRAHTQREQYLKLATYGTQGLEEGLLSTAGLTKPILKSLSKKGLVTSHSLSSQPTHIDDSPTNTRNHTGESDKPTELLKEPNLQLNNEQHHAVTTVTQSQNKYHGFLLDGITGSGKTEVYLQVIHNVINAGKQALVIVPEIGLTPQTIARFESRFNANIVRLHSGLNPTERLTGWQKAANGSAQIVIGTRSAVLTPFAKLGVIIVDEEHDASFKQQSTLRYHARDVALYRGVQESCPVLLGSATPSLESLHRVDLGKLTLLRLTNRAGDAKSPQLKIIDVRGKYLQSKLSDAAIDAIRHTLAKNKQVLVFLNRRGYAPVLLCDACGWQGDCPRCDARLTLHQTPYSYLKCHHCDWVQHRMPKTCPDCGSENLKPVGAGTERLEETLAEQFPSYPLIRVDRDTTRRKDSWKTIYNTIEMHDAAILLGTQMLAKGHHFPKVTLVVMPNVDNGLLSSDFRAPERIAQLTMQVAGRAGRGEKAGTVLLQTKQPDNPMLNDLVSAGYDTFASTALAERARFHLPPYRHAALVRAEAKKQPYNMEFLTLALTHLPAMPNLTVWGPLASPMEKKASRYHAQLVIMSNNRRQLHDLIKVWWQHILTMPERKYIKLTLDIDPCEW